MMQIVRGEPIVYTTWPGYDTVAHYSGPWSNHALGTLRGFDRLVGSIRAIIETDAPRPYELLLISDHGQSFGATFKMRYGYTLLEFIERYIPEETITDEELDPEDGTLAMLATAAELGNVREQHLTGWIGEATAEQLQHTAERAAASPVEASVSAEAVDVTFCGSGNLAQVYFHAIPLRATRGELDAAFPGLVDAIAGHEGVGVVVVADDDGVPVAFGRRGARNLHTGVVTGLDPLAAYGDVDLRAWQLRRVADFPSTGDLLILSAVYPDGTVAALEEQIGSHGGLGGEQTDTFLLHPAGISIPPTRNATDMYAILNARRPPG
jgi:hypothetical protein